MNVRCPLRRQALKSPDAPFIRTADGAISFAGADRQVAGYARGLAAAGLGPGSTAAICSGNDLRYCCLIFAAARCGVTLAHVSPKFTPVERSRAARIARAEAVIGEPIPGIRSVQVECREDTSAPPQGVPEDEPLAVVFTSGSTGEPKGAELCCSALDQAACASNHRTGFSGPDCWLLSLPLCHVGGIGILYRAAAAGAAVRVASRGGAESVREALEADPGITHLSLVPTVLGDLLDLGCDRLKSVRMILLGGGAVPDRIVKAARARKLPVFMSYGMTESCSHVTLGPLESDPRCCGAPLEGVQIGIEEGEIVIRFPALFRGYRTLSGFEPAAAPFRTRDLGVVEKGKLFWRGRRDRMFTSGGENVYPEEIESAAEGCPGVIEAVASPVPDPRWGMRPELRVKVLGDLKVTTLQNWLAERLAPHKRPQRIEVVESFPRSAAGKTDRHKTPSALRGGSR